MLAALRHCGIAALRHCAGGELTGQESVCSAATVRLLGTNKQALADGTSKRRLMSCLCPGRHGESHMKREDENLIITVSSFVYAPIALMLIITVVLVALAA
jgi:hypothetical protein